MYESLGIKPYIVFDHALNTSFTNPIFNQIVLTNNAFAVNAKYIEQETNNMGRQQKELRSFYMWKCLVLDSQVMFDP